jgi:hypothetical protein
MPGRKSIALRTDLSVDECLRRLREGTDIGIRTIFSLSGYKGKNPVLSRSEGDKFRLWKRKYYRNDFAPVFFGSVTREEPGSRIEGRFEMEPLVKKFMIFWLAVVGLGGLTTVYSEFAHHHARDARQEAALVGAMLLFGLLLPQFGRLIGLGQEKFLREFLETMLEARRANPELPLSASAIENKPLG